MEAAALYAALMWIAVLLTKYPDTTDNASKTPALPILIDNQSVIDDITQPLTKLTLTFQLLMPDYDIIQAIQQLITEIPVPLDIFHVKAHQDHEKHFGELTPCAQINVLVDQYAERLHQCNTAFIGVFPTWIPGTAAALYHGLTQIMTNIPNDIHNATHEPPMCTYLIKWSKTASDCDSKWMNITYDNIAWQHLGKAFQ